MHFNYYWAGELAVAGQRQELTTAQKMQRFRRTQPGGMVARCTALESEKLPFTSRLGNLCCIKF